MQKSSTSTGSTPPETPAIRPSFGRRLLAFLAYGSGRSLTSSPPFLPHSDATVEVLRRIAPEGWPNDPLWVKESRDSLAMQEGARARSEQPAKGEARRALESADPYLAGYTYSGDTRDRPPLGPPPAFLDLPETARHFADRYTRDMGETAARARAWLDALEYRRRLQNADVCIAGQSSTIQDRDAALDAANRRAEEAEKVAGVSMDTRTQLRDTKTALRAATARADMLNNAIQYALQDERLGMHSGLDWLRDWNEGDEDMDDELRAWIESEKPYDRGGETGPEPDVQGTAVFGRNGLCDVPPAVGRERPRAPEVQPTNRRGFAPGHVTRVEGEELSRPVPLYTTPIGPRDLSRGGVGFARGVTCLELGGERYSNWNAYSDSFDQRPGVVTSKHRKA